MTSSNDLPAGIRLRSAQWYAGDDRNACVHRAWTGRGMPGDAFTGIGPPGTTTAGRSTEAPAISKDGMVLSQLPSSTTPSTGLARSISSVAIAAMLRSDPPAAASERHAAQEFRRQYRSSARRRSAPCRVRIVTMAVVGGSTNAVVHLLAIAGRFGIDLTLDDFDRIGPHVPLLVDLQPAWAVACSRLPASRGSKHW
jgi:Dehydratase family